MEFKKTANFLDTTSDNINLPRFGTKKWIEVYDQGKKLEFLSLIKEIRIKTSMVTSDLCDYSDAYIVVKGRVIVDKITFTDNDFDALNNTAVKTF